MTKNWIWTDHILEQIAERELSKDLIESIVNKPDEVVQGKFERQIYHKFVNDKLIRIIADGRVLLTVYETSKIKKYIKGNLQ